MSARRAVGWLAVAVLAVAIVVALIPHSVVGDQVYPTVGCGSVLVPSTDARSTDLGAAMAGFSRDYESKCSDAMVVPRVATLALAGASLLVLGFLLLTRRSGPAAAEYEDDEQEQHDYQ